ncbi:gamma-glutamylcyclotransferase [Salipiger bermudensis]|uniref:gamma-glutamylcyclotransferase n=1 Tax=Salipiger bermudensis TaxID=344736 RepID=UPI001CD1F973|nr:gamma-glutamylcyclotransferase [Salipiger bermudensis]MCA0962821.1 gamma-glutamylcyclotransferase [Salipiger bermudensis]
MSSAFFFGYGSLVNRLTHGFAPTHTARARGWRRAWRWTEARDVAFLTAVPDPDCEIEGLIAPVPPDGWAALDLREHAYDRLDALHSVTHEAPGVEQLAIYAIPPERIFAPDARHPVLLSYLDVVVQGYLAEFGAHGADRFFATTTGWEAPILDDRADPRYPRAQRLSDDERCFVDDRLAGLGARKVAA